MTNQYSYLLLTVLTKNFFHFTVCICLGTLLNNEFFHLSVKQTHKRPRVLGRPYLRKRPYEAICPSAVVVHRLFRWEKYMSRKFTSAVLYAAVWLTYIKMNSEN